MEKLHFVLLSILIFLSSFAEGQMKDDTYKLGIYFDSLNLECTENFTLVFNSSQLINGSSCKINGFIFSIGRDNSRKVIYYSTTDTNFTINKMRYLRQDKPYLDSIKALKIIYEPGWAVYIEVDNGWNLAFSNKDIIYVNGVGELKIGAIPSFLFKRGVYHLNGTEVPKKWKKYRVKRT